MTNLIPSLYNNTLQAPLQQTEGASSSYSIITISNVIRKCINIPPKEATASHSVTSCSDSKVLSRQSKAAKLRSKNPEYRKKLSEAAKLRSKNPEYRKKLSEAAKLRSKDPKYRDARKRLQEDPKYREKLSEAAKLRWKEDQWKTPEYRKKLSEIAKLRWKEDRREDPEYRKKLSNSTKRLWKDPEFRKKISDGRKRQLENPKYIEAKKRRIQLSIQRADEAIASVLAQQREIKIEPQEDVFPQGDHELQMTGCSRVIHEINNNLPILQDPKDPAHSLFYEVEGSIDQIKISRYGDLQLSSSQKKQILEEVKEWIRANENDRESYQQKLDELFEISIPIEIGPDRGRSVYAKRNIRKLEVVGPYAGILQRSEEEWSHLVRQKGSYNVSSYLFTTRSKHRSIDGFGTGNTTSLINTGQLPGKPIWNDNNLAIIQVGKNLNFYIAKRDISEGEELLIDYGPDYNPMFFLKVETEDPKK